MSSMVVDISLEFRLSSYYLHKKKKKSITKTTTNFDFLLVMQILIDHLYNVLSSHCVVVNIAVL